MNEFEHDYSPFTDHLATEMPVDPRRERRQIASVALGVAFIVLFASLVQLLAVYVIRSVAPHLIERDWFVIVLSMVPMYAIAMPLSLLLFRFGRAEPPTEKRSLSPLLMCGLVCVCFVLTYAGNVIGLIVNAILTLLTGEPPVHDLQNLTMNTPFWANLLFCGILAPVLEEIFYRKMVLDRLRRYGDLTAILMSGLLFGLIHGNFYQFFYATMIGLLFGYIYLHTGKLRYTVALHACVNFIGGVFMTEVSKRLDMEALAENPMAFLLENGPLMATYVLYLFFLLACLIIAPVTVALVWKHIRFRRAQVRLTAPRFLRTVILNPAVWLLAGVIIMLFLS